MEKINTYVKFIGDMFEANINGEKYPKIRIEVLQRSDAPQPTSPESDVVKILRSAIKLVRGIDTRVGGIGGGTVAALLRKRGIPAAVWSTIDETAHQPNEYAKIDNLVSDSKVFSLLPIL
jgi:succinyl-diaminopimelate desuccinylase